MSNFSDSQVIIKQDDHLNSSLVAEGNELTTSRKKRNIKIVLAVILLVLIATGCLLVYFFYWKSDSIEGTNNSTRVVSTSTTDKSIDRIQYRIEESPTDGRKNIQLPQHQQDISNSQTSSTSSASFDIRNQPSSIERDITVVDESSPCILDNLSELIASTLSSQLCLKRMQSMMISNCLRQLSSSSNKCDELNSREQLEEILEFPESHGIPTSALFPSNHDGEDNSNNSNIKCEKESTLNNNNISFIFYNLLITREEEQIQENLEEDGSSFSIKNVKLHLQSFGPVIMLMQHLSPIDTNQRSNEFENIKNNKVDIKYTAYKIIEWKLVTTPSSMSTPVLHWIIQTSVSSQQETSEDIVIRATDPNIIGYYGYIPKIE